MVAASHDNLEAVQALIELGASVEVKDYVSRYSGFHVGVVRNYLFTQTNNMVGAP